MAARHNADSTPTASANAVPLRRHLQRDGEVGAEARAFQRQVPVDVAQFLGQHGVLAGGAKRVAGEVGELQDQLAGAVGVGAHEGGNGVERVVDEVRADLRAQRQDFGTVEAGAGSVELGEFDLAGGVARDLAHRAEHPGAGGAVRHHHQHADGTAAVGTEWLGNHSGRLGARQHPSLS